MIMGTFVTYLPPEQSIKTTIRVPKQEAAYTYFILEASEGLCFYSTIDESLGEGYRDIEIVTPWHFREEVSSLLTTLSGQYKLEIIDVSQA
jgi:hypothetical protein